MNESKIDRLLAAAPVEPLPQGFRSRVMRRVTSSPSRAWEWLVAAALAVPSLGYVIFVVLSYGADFASMLGDLAAAAQGTEEIVSPVFFIDGLVVLAVALCGLASAIAAHALLASTDGRRTPLAR